MDDSGFIFVVGRKKDIVIRGGENVSSAEVEGAIFHFDQVAEACVFEVADERLGEEIGAAIVLRSGYQATAGELRAHLALHIARYKIPRYLWILDRPLPRGATGKFLRRELRTMLHVEDAQ